MKYIYWNAIETTVQTCPVSNGHLDNIIIGAISVEKGTKQEVGSQVVAYIKEESQIEMDTCLHVLASSVQLLTHLRELVDLMTGNLSVILPMTFVTGIAMYNSLSTSVSGELTMVISRDTVWSSARYGSDCYAYMSNFTNSGVKKIVQLLLPCNNKVALSTVTTQIRKSTMKSASDVTGSMSLTAPRGVNHTSIVTIASAAKTDSGRCKGRGSTLDGDRTGGHTVDILKAAADGPETDEDER